MCATLYSKYLRGVKGRDVHTRKGPQQTQDTTVTAASCTIISTSSVQNKEADDAVDARRSLLPEGVVFPFLDFILACSSASPLTMLQNREKNKAKRPREEKTKTRVVSADPWIGKKHHVLGNWRIYLPVEKNGDRARTSAKVDKNSTTDFAWAAVTIETWKNGCVIATQRSTAIAKPKNKEHKPKNTILAPKTLQKGSPVCKTPWFKCTCSANAPKITWPNRSATSKATVSSRNDFFDWRRNRPRDRASIPRAVRLEMAPNSMVNKDIPKPSGLGTEGEVVLVADTLGKDTFIGTLGVVIVSVTYRKIQK